MSEMNTENFTHLLPLHSFSLTGSEITGRRSESCRGVKRGAQYIGLMLHDEGGPSHGKFSKHISAGGNLTGRRFLIQHSIRGRPGDEVRVVGKGRYRVLDRALR